MGTCKKCYKRDKCLEANEYGKCIEFKKRTSIAAEIEQINAEMRSVSITRTDIAGDAGDDEGEEAEGDREYSEGLLLSFCDAVQKEAVNNEWYRVFGGSTINAVLRDGTGVHLDYSHKDIYAGDQREENEDVQGAL
jgi:hypothetical protein